MTRKVLLPLFLAIVAALAAAAPARAETVYAIQPGNTLIRFDTAVPASSVVTIGAVSGLGVNETIRGIDFRPSNGLLYASTATTGSAANSQVFTYTINPSTAVATPVGATVALPGAGDIPTGYSVNPRATGGVPTPAELTRYVNTNDENARLNLDNGGLFLNDNNVTPAATTTIIAETHGGNTTGDTATLYAIDRTDSRVSVQGGINGAPSANGGIVTDLAPLGFTLNAANDGGLDLSPNSGTAFAALTNAADNVTRLYSVGLPTALTATPQATEIGPIGNGASEVRTLAIAANPPAAGPSTPATPTGTPTQAPPRDTRKPLARFALKSSRLDLSNLVRGFVVPFTSDEAGTARGVLGVPGFARASATIATGRARLRGPGTGRIRIKSNRSQRRRVRRLQRRLRRSRKRTRRASLVLTITDSSGNRTVLRKALRVKP